MDISKLRKSLQKKNIPTELSKPDVFLSTGNYALNFIMMGQFGRGLPNKRSITLAGEPGTGKSFLAANFAKIAQDAGYLVVYMETENAADEGYLLKIGMDLSEDKFLPIRVRTVEQATEAFMEIVNNTSPEDKIFLIVDSLSMMSTDSVVEKLEKSGTQGSDMGLMAKKTKQFIKDVNYYVGNRDMFAVFTSHVYENQDILNGKGRYIINGGTAPLYIPSMVLLLTKKKLKEGVKEDMINGVIIKVEAMKTRFTKLGGTVELKVPYDRGIDPLDGLLEKLALDPSIGLEKNGGWYSYVDKSTGEVVKFQAGNFHKHVDNLISLNGEQEVVETFVAGMEEDDAD